MSDVEQKLKPITRSRTSSSGSDAKSKGKVSFAHTAQVSVSSDNNQQDSISVPTKTSAGGGSARRTAETFSDKSSVTSGDSGGVYEVIEYDPSLQVRSATFDSGLDVMYEEDDDYMGIEPDIGENTPAAEALRASAAVRVSRVGKAARAVNMQAVRKLVKRATLSSKSGVVKGKPPRLPPNSPMHYEGDESEGAEETDDDDDDHHINEAHVHLAQQQHQEEQEQQQAHQQAHSHHVSTHASGKDHIPDDVVAGTAEAGSKVLGSVDPHGIVKVLRFRKKRKGTGNKPKSYAKGKVIDGEHELYTLSIAVMIGVRTSISKTNTILNSGPTSKRWVIPQDYRTTEKYEFRPKGGTGLPAHQLAHTFKFKDYAPIVFAYLRRLAGINEFDFLISVCGNANFIEFISNAKSGQFFFYSSDGQYMIKTMTNAESKFLRRILPDYFKHCCENPNTMITRFFGMYRVKLYHLRRNVKFVIMNSVYFTDKYLQTFYDLKGSVVGRDSKPGQAVKKDNDLRRVIRTEALSLAPETRARVREQLVKDTKFMNAMGIMDYSMLVGIHHVPPATDRSIATTGFRTSTRKLNRRSMIDHHDTPDSQRLLATPLGQPSSLSSLEHNNATPVSASTRRLETEMGLHLGDDLDDDDSSYLKGSDKRPKEITRVHEETEQKKLATIEKLFWPFHQLFDIHGHRRLTLASYTADGESPVPEENLQGYNVRKFQPPLSDRKDGGFEMDMTGLSLPMIFKGPNGDQLYEGKIFYMGIIDILQEYNSRKMVEAQYRLLQASGKTEASCVDPKTYGKRFLQFFDEYTAKAAPGADEGVEMTLGASAMIGGAPSTPESRKSLVDPAHASATARGDEGKLAAISEEGHRASKSDDSSKNSSKGRADGRNRSGHKKPPADVTVIEPAKKSPTRKTATHHAPKGSAKKSSTEGLSIVEPVSPARKSAESKVLADTHASSRTTEEDVPASPRRLFGGQHGKAAKDKH